MKTIFKFILPVLFAISLISCEKEVEDLPKAESFQFDDLQAGDVMLYSYFTGNEYFEQEPTEVIYTGDTLELRVLEEFDGKFIIQETILPGSAIFQSQDKYIWGKIDEPTELLWDIQEDEMTMENHGLSDLNQSHLLFYRHSYSLKKITDNEIAFDEWKTTLPMAHAGTEFHIKNGELHGFTYPHLNALMSGLSPVDADATTHIYNAKSGFVRTSSISPWTSLVRGWDRIN